MSTKMLQFLLIATIFAINKASFLQQSTQSLSKELQVNDLLVPPLTQVYQQNVISNDDVPKTKPHQENLNEAAELPWFQRFSKSFGYSFLIIFTAQLADKTFVMIIILAMTYGRTQIFLGSSLALIIMHTLAVLLGAVVPQIFSKNYIKIGSVVVFSLFGVYLIYKGYRKKNKSVEEKLKKVEQQLQKTGKIEAAESNENSYHQLQKQALLSDPQDPHLNFKIQVNQVESNNEKHPSSMSSQSEVPSTQFQTNASTPQVQALVKSNSQDGIMSPLKLDQVENSLNQPLLNSANEQLIQSNATANNMSGVKNLNKRGCWKMFLKSAFMKMFLIGLVSQMGDRSQITAVALGASNEVWGVIIGGSFGHVLCSLFGVWLGLIFMNRISAGKLIIFGGIVCLFFAIDILIFG